MSRVTERAFEIAAKTYLRAANDGLAHPFGLDKSSGRYRWRVSQDVWAELVAYVGFGDPAEPDPTTGLLGDPLVVDESLPANSMLLEAETP